MIHHVWTEVWNVLKRRFFVANIRARSESWHVAIDVTLGMWSHYVIWKICDPNVGERVLRCIEGDVSNQIFVGKLLMRSIRFTSFIRTLTSRGSFSAVSTPIFATKYSLESSRRDLHNALLCTVLDFYLISNVWIFLVKCLLFFLIFAKKIADFSKLLLNFAEFWWIFFGILSKYSLGRGG